MLPCSDLFVASLNHQLGFKDLVEEYDMEAKIQILLLGNTSWAGQREGRLSRGTWTQYTQVGVEEV